MKDWVMVLGGGPWQVDLIRAVGALGYRCLVVDISPAAPGRSLADVFLPVNTDDRQQLLRVASTYGVSLVVSDQSDRLVPVWGFLNESLGHSGICRDVARRFTDKLVMRQTVSGLGLPVPPYACVASADEAAARAAAFGYPVILKPRRAWGSRGVRRVGDEPALRRAFPQSLRESPDGTLLVEEFIDGVEVTVEGISLGGTYYPLAISEKEHFPFNCCVARRLAYPPRQEATVLHRLRGVAQRVVTGLGLRDGISHAEFRLRAGTPYLMEVAARGGGNRIASAIVPHVSGIDVYGLLLRRLAGQSVTVPPRLGRAALLSFFDFPPGRVGGVEGVEEVRRRKLVHDIAMTFRPGDTLGQPTDDHGRHGYMIVLGESRDEIDAAAGQAERLVRVRYAS